MVLRTCERCGEVEFEAEGESQRHTIEHGGESYSVCTRCYIELVDWFYDREPDRAPLETTSS
jgi:hypothetical protein